MSDQQISVTDLTNYSVILANYNCEITLHIHWQHLHALIIAMFNKTIAAKSSSLPQPDLTVSINGLTSRPKKGWKRHLHQSTDTLSSHNVHLRHICILLQNLTHWSLTSNRHLLCSWSRLGPFCPNRSLWDTSTINGIKTLGFRTH